ncbi:hypothetical protein EBT31_01765 [bacterium]|nr:hypothetical protein [bacterium]
MLDNGIIKDLVFPNARYTTGSADKLALGISFVLAKQWVDTHASNVKRAIVRRSEEGVYMGKAKHGYYKDRNGYMRPDDENWTLIKEAFDRRMKGDSLSSIADWLKAEGYPKQTRHGKRPTIIIDDAFMSSVFKEPIYAGVSVYGNEVTDLRAAYDFEPVISEEDFCAMNGLDGIERHVMASRHKKEIRGNFLRGIVICLGCDRPLAPTVTTKPKQKTKYFYYRCDTQGCPYYRINVRAKLLIDAALGFVRSHPITQPHIYDHFVQEVRRIAEERRLKSADESRSLEQQRNAARRQLSDLKEMLQKNDDRDVQRLFNVDLKKMALKVRELDQAIKKLAKEREVLKERIPTYEKFVELTRSLAEILDQITVVRQLDWSFRKLFSNFYVEGKKVAKITQNSPYRELCGSPDSAMVTPARVELALQA